MIDNISLVKNHSPSQDFWQKSKKGKPFEYRKLMFYPEFRWGNNVKYATTLKNLRLLFFDDKVRLDNSFHKFYHGGNWNDYTHSEIINTIEEINDITGIDWYYSQVQDVEYGCNLPLNPEQVYSTLLSYKGKDYQPMISKGSVYGRKAHLTDYTVKAYNKKHAAKTVEKINIKDTFRWEIYASRKHLERVIGSPSLLVNLVEKDNLLLLAHDAIMKFDSSIKNNVMHLHKLKPGQKRIVAVMQNPLIRDDFKRHNKETFKRDSRIYREIMNDPKICENTSAGLLIEQKFLDLLNG